MNNIKSVLFLGREKTLRTLYTYEYFFREKGFRVIEATTFEEAVQMLIAEPVSLMVVYAYGDIFSKPIDAYKGNLPPIIYWYIPGTDAIPKREDVVCIENTTLPSDVLKFAANFFQA